MQVKLFLILTMWYILTPEYDNSNPFECINNLYNDTTESQVYDWSVIDHIFEKDNDIKNQLREKVNNFFE